jgi:hypothetical protein
MFGKKFKAQSAMEYLMTYGWAILIIAVVLGALFSLGVFNSSSLIGTSCVALSGYYCANPVLTGNTLTLTVGQATGTSYSGVIAYIVPSGSTFSTSNSSSYPSNSISGGLSSGQTASITVSLPSLGASPALGTAFTGQVWLGYTPSGSSSTLYTQIATLSVKVT